MFGFGWAKKLYLWAKNRWQGKSTTDDTPQVKSTSTSGSSTSSFFSRLFSSGDAQAGSNIKALLENAKQDTQDGVSATYTLLGMKNLQRHLTHRQIIDLLYLHEEGHLNVDTVIASLKKNKLSLFDLAKKSDAVGALKILTSPFAEKLTAVEQAELAYQYRHDADYLSAMKQEVAYNNQYIKPLLKILDQAHIEGTYNKALKFIRKSASLLFLLHKEIEMEDSKKAEQKDANAPLITSSVIDPYKVLNVPRDASDTDIKKAYKKMALKVHPDKIATQYGDRFKEVSNAYEILSNQEKRKAWDDANTPIVIPPRKTGWFGRH